VSRINDRNSTFTKSLCQLVERLAQESLGKKVCILAAPGDRRNEDIREIARLSAGYFDRYICRQDDRTRGRPSGEIPQLLKDGLMEFGVAEDAIEIIPSEQEAVERALDICEQGDLLLIFADKITRSWKQIIYFHDQQKQEEPETESLLMESNFSDVLGDFQQDERGVFLSVEQSD